MLMTDYWLQGTSSRPVKPLHSEHHLHHLVHAFNMFCPKARLIGKPNEGRFCSIIHIPHTSLSHLKKTFSLSEPLARKQIMSIKVYANHPSSMKDVGLSPPNRHIQLVGSGTVVLQRENRRLVQGSSIPELSMHFV